MRSDDDNNQVKLATEVEVMPNPTQLVIPDKVASYVAAMAENQVTSLSQRITELDASNKVFVVSSSFSMTDNYGKHISASAYISFT